MNGPLAPWLNRLPLVAILRGVKPDEVLAVADALLANGFAIIEVPLNSPDPYDSIERLATHCGQRALVGAGTVTEETQVIEVGARGGQLIVMPHADERVVRAAKLNGLIALPGFATPTEAFRMLEAGADGLKLFPAEAMPPAVLRAMRAVLPRDLPVLPVGSITPGNMAPYVAAGASGFGLGGALYKVGDPPELVAARAEGFVAAWRDIDADGMNR